MRDSKFKIQNLFILSCILCFAFLTGCSIPNFEKPECTEARQQVKEFYSYHFGNDMKFSPENLRQREKFLTPEFAKSLENSPPDNDVFTTNSTDYPKAFRISRCEVIAPDKTSIEVLLFWKDNSRSEQREIKIEAVKQNDTWLINKVTN
jgi:hypothetical protein